MGALQFIYIRVLCHVRQLSSGWLRNIGLCSDMGLIMDSCSVPLTGNHRGRAFYNAGMNFDFE